jgi:thiamine biosynthesis lipoprotein
MGTDVTLLSPTSEAPGAAGRLRDLVEAWESTLSRFRPESELSRLNASAGGTVAVGELLYRVTSIALEAAEATGGLFDPTLLRALERVGYDTTFEQIPESVPASPGWPVRAEGWRRIRLDPRRRRISLPAGVGLDFGGIAKGLCVDAAVRQLVEDGTGAALVSAGGDLRVTGLPPGRRSWPISVGAGRSRQTVPLAAGAIATSGRTRRTWQQGGRVRHHLLDPRTLEPAESGLGTVSVAAGTCAQAEVAATVAFLLGAERGARFLVERRLAGLFVSDDGSATAAGGWRAWHAEAA